MREKKGEDTKTQPPLNYQELSKTCHPNSVLSLDASKDMRLRNLGCFMMSHASPKSVYGVHLLARAQNTPTSFSFLSIFKFIKILTCS